MHATFVTLWLQVVQPLANVHETKWTPHVKRETDVAQSYTSSAGIYQWEDVPNGSDDWAGRKYELPSGYRIHHYSTG